MYEDFNTIEVAVVDGVATVTLNRPEALNSFDQEMCDEFARLWDRFRADDAVRVIVLQANGERAFSTGMDRSAGIADVQNPWARRGPGYKLGPKAAHLFKPVITLVQGMCAGGAFYWVCESDIVVCSEDAQFFDPHVSYGMASPFIPPGLMRRIPAGEAMRICLMGLDERVSAARAYQIGLVSEVTSPESLRTRGQEIACKIAAKSPDAVQATVRAGWDSIGKHPVETDYSNLLYSSIVKLSSQGEQLTLRAAGKVAWRLR